MTAPHLLLAFLLVTGPLVGPLVVPTSRSAAAAVPVLDRPSPSEAARAADGVGESTPAAGGTWPLRLVPEVARGFAAPVTRWGPGHRGVDLLGTVGQPVRAALAGTVAFVGRIAGRGVVVVSHGATRTTYEPVAATVRVGEHVAAGARLGRLELVGSHCLPRACLHWGLLQGERYLDPLVLVGAGPVRLLPWLDGSALRAAALAVGAAPSLPAVVGAAPSGPVGRPFGHGPVLPPTPDP